VFNLNSFCSLYEQLAKLQSLLASYLDHEAVFSMSCILVSNCV